MSSIKSLRSQPAGDGPRPVAVKSVAHTLTVGQYHLHYEVYGSGDRVLVWLNPILFDSKLSRGLARALAARGNRVVLLDLLGHGQSDKPVQPSAHRMDLYAQHVLALLDELGVDQAVLGGISLGTNVSLLTAAQAPERVRGLVLEMPVLETAVPAAALTFVPLLLQVRYARDPLRLVSRVVSRLPSSGIGPLDSLVGTIGSDPDEISAVLRGMLHGTHGADRRTAKRHHRAGPGARARNRPHPLVRRREEARAPASRRDGSSAPAHSPNCGYALPG